MIHFQSLCVLVGSNLSARRIRVELFKKYLSQDVQFFEKEENAITNLLVNLTESPGYIAEVNSCINNRNSIIKFFQKSIVIGNSNWICDSCTCRCVCKCCCITIWIMGHSINYTAFICYPCWILGF